MSTNRVLGRKSVRQNDNVLAKQSPSFVWVPRSRLSDYTPAGIGTSAYS